MINKIRNHRLLAKNFRTFANETFKPEVYSKFGKIMSNYIEDCGKDSVNVLNFTLPGAIKKQIDLSVNEEPNSDEWLLSHVEDILQNSVKAHHKHFHNQLFAGYDMYANLGDILVSSINGSMYTYEMAPSFTLMERNVIDYIGEKHFGWGNKALTSQVSKFGSKTSENISDGVMTAGGSIANLYGMMCAKQKQFPQSKEEGLRGLPAMKIFTSELCHYSVNKATVIMGLGRDSIVNVRTDKNGRMIADDLEEKVHQERAKGNHALMVNATVGTTVMGSIDPVKEISDICNRNKLWLHVDAALGGSLYFTETELKQYMPYVDSVTMDFHKYLVTPLQTSLFMTRHQGLMYEMNSMNAGYLFMPGREDYDASLDTGDKTIQCGRKIDILKFWLKLKKHGMKGLNEQVRRQLDIAQYFASIVRANKNFKIIHDPETHNVCFYYIPDGVLNYMAQNPQFDILECDELLGQLGAATVWGKKKMAEDGKIMVGFSTSGRFKNFWRMVCVNPFNTEQDFDHTLSLIQKYSESYYKENNVTIEKYWK